MRSSKIALCLAAALAVVLWMPSSAYAGEDEFENGFKQELGAIGARTVVGLGIGLFNGVAQGGVGYNGLYAYPSGGYYTPRPYGYRGGYGHGDGYYRYESYEREYRHDGPYRPYHPHKKFKHHRPRRHHDDHHYSHGPSCGGDYYHYEYERYRRY